MQESGSVPSSGAVSSFLFNFVGGDGIFAVDLDTLRRRRAGVGEDPRQREWQGRFTQLTTAKLGGPRIPRIRRTFMGIWGS